MATLSNHIDLKNLKNSKQNYRIGMWLNDKALPKILKALGSIYISTHAGTHAHAYINY